MTDRTIGAPPALLPIIGLVILLAGCVPGNGPGTDHPATAAGAAGSLARGPLPAMQPTSTSVGPADTGPAGSAAAVGDGSAFYGH